MMELGSKAREAWQTGSGKEEEGGAGRGEKLQGRRKQLKIKGQTKARNRDLEGQTKAGSGAGSWSPDTLIHLPNPWVLTGSGTSPDF